MNTEYFENPEKTLVDILGKKSHYDNKEVLSILKRYSQQMKDLAKESSKNTFRKTSVVDEVKKYDVLRCTGFGFIHYGIVFRVHNDKVFLVLLSSSKDEEFSVKTLEGDRIFKGGSASFSMQMVDIGKAKEGFVSVYEDKQEADEIFEILKSQYKGLFEL